MGCTPGISALGMLKQRGHELKGSLGDIVKPSLKEKMDGQIEGKQRWGRKEEREKRKGGRGRK